MIHRIFAGYLWLWSSLFTSILLYIPLFFWGRGNITIGDRFWNFKVHRRQGIDDPDGLRRHALRMIAYVIQPLPPSQKKMSDTGYAMLPAILSSLGYRSYRSVSGVG